MMQRPNARTSGYNKKVGGTYSLDLLPGDGALRSAHALLGVLVHKPPA